MQANVTTLDASTAGTVEEVKNRVALAALCIEVGRRVDVVITEGVHGL